MVLHHLQLASHEIAEIWQKGDKISKFQIPIKVTFLSFCIAGEHKIDKRCCEKVASDLGYGGGFSRVLQCPHILLRSPPPLTTG